MPQAVMSEQLCSPEAIAKLNDAVFRAQYLVKIYASSQETRPEILLKSISRQIDAQDLQWLIIHFETADFSTIPTVEVCDRLSIGNAAYRYHSDSNCLYLAGDYVETVSKETLLTVFLKETISALKAQQTDETL